MMHRRLCEQMVVVLEKYPIFQRAIYFIEVALPHSQCICRLIYKNSTEDSMIGIDCSSN